MESLIVPSEFCIYYNDQKSVASMALIIALWHRGNQAPVELDLRQVKTATAGATLILFAHVNALQLRHQSKKRVVCRFPTRKDNPDGYACIVQSGLSRALVSGTVADLDALAKDGIRFQSSNDPGTHAPFTVAYLTKHLGLPSDNQFVLMLSAAISEAMLNVQHHAYCVERDDFTGQLHSRWWQLSWYDRTRGRFIFLIYDLGVGIVRSYKTSLLFDMDDRDAFGQALSYGFSRFHATEPWRGSGSEDLKHPIVLGEQLLIWCDSLRYKYLGEDQVTTITKTRVPMRGSLVEWVLEDSSRRASDDEHDH
jgi:hypothetical protein